MLNISYIYILYNHNVDKQWSKEDATGDGGWRMSATTTWPASSTMVHATYYLHQYHCIPLLTVIKSQSATPPPGPPRAATSSSSSSDLLFPGWRWLSPPKSFSSPTTVFFLYGDSDVSVTISTSITAFLSSLRSNHNQPHRRQVLHVLPVLHLLHQIYSSLVGDGCHHPHHCDPCLSLVLPTNYGHRVIHKKVQILFGYLTASPAIATAKLMGSSNCVSWSKAVEKWCKAQGLIDHLTTNLEDVTTKLEDVKNERIIGKKGMLCCVLKEPNTKSHKILKNKRPMIVEVIVLLVLSVIIVINGDIPKIGATSYNVVPLAHTDDIQSQHSSDTSHQNSITLSGAYDEYMRQCAL
ncbi:hypothetical protein RIF29_10068 [Crotalaria pallida]|uniref:Uncharacterized protein n=1 Tax=Crotalaria pallida TaxID=3830 RepID=A0AAN9FYM5_CROPI